MPADTITHPPPYGSRSIILQSANRSFLRLQTRVRPSARDNRKTLSSVKSTVLHCRWVHLKCALDHCLRVRLCRRVKAVAITGLLALRPRSFSLLSIVCTLTLTQRVFLSSWRSFGALKILEHNDSITTWWSSALVVARVRLLPRLSATSSVCWYLWYRRLTTLWETPNFAATSIWRLPSSNCPIACQRCLSVKRLHPTMPTVIFDTLWKLSFRKQTIWWTDTCRKSTLYCAWNLLPNPHIVYSFSFE